jgi:hypothetical protein
MNEITCINEYAYTPEISFNMGLFLGFMIGLFLYHFVSLFIKETK